jgi:hypothetical protein
MLRWRGRGAGAELMLKRVAARRRGSESLGRAGRARKWGEQARRVLCGRSILTEYGHGRGLGSIRFHRPYCDLNGRSAGSLANPSSVLEPPRSFKLRAPPLKTISSIAPSRAACWSFPSAFISNWN